MKTLRSAVVILTVLTTLSLSGCKALGLTTPEPVAVELGATHTSERFGYSISHPEGWIVEESVGPWLDFEALGPTNTLGIDTFATYSDGRNLALGVGARSTSIDGADLATVETNVATLLTSGDVFFCLDLEQTTPGAAEHITIGGEDALLIRNPCTTPDQGYYIVALTIHNDQVYWFTYAASPGDPDADYGLFTQILETVEFTS